MKSLNRIVPTVKKIKKQRKRIQETQLLIDAIIESMPLTERERIVDLCLSLISEKDEKGDQWQHEKGERISISR